MREWANVRTHRHRHARRELFAKLPRVKIEHLAFRRGLRRSCGMFREVFENREGRHGKDLLVAHDPHRFIAELEGMIHRHYARAGGVKRPGFSGGVYRHALAHARGLLHRGAKLGFGVLVGRGELAAVVRVGAGLVDLDEIRAFLELLPDRLHQLPRVVRPRGVGEHALLGVEAVCIFVPAEDVDGIAADAQARTRNPAIVDGVAYGGVGRPRARSSRPLLLYVWSDPLCES